MSLLFLRQSWFRLRDYFGSFNSIFMRKVSIILYLLGPNILLGKCKDHSQADFFHKGRQLATHPPYARTSHKKSMISRKFRKKDHTTRGFHLVCKSVRFVWEITKSLVVCLLQHRSSLSLTKALLAESLRRTRVQSNMRVQVFLKRRIVTILLIGWIYLFYQSIKVMQII